MLDLFGILPLFSGVTGISDVKEIAGGPDSLSLSLSSDAVLVIASK